MTGDYIISVSSQLLSQIRNEEVVIILSQVLEDLVKGEFTLVVLESHSVTLFVDSGEFMQLGSKEGAEERFQHYLVKTYKKTASLIANSCKAVTIFNKYFSFFVFICRYMYMY